MKRSLFTVSLLLFAAGAFAQVTPAAGNTPSHDTSKFSVGATIFGDYTYQDSATAKDADGNVQALGRIRM